MASFTSPLCILTVAALIFSVLGQDTNIRCYNCESERNKACDDPVDVSVLQLMDCNTGAYNPPPREEDTRSMTDQVLSKPVDGKFRGAPIIEEIFKENSAQRALNSNKCVCLKVFLTTPDGLKSTTRTAVKVASNIKDPCDFVKQEADPKVTVDRCYYCDTDKCNGASFLVVSGITLMSALLIVILRQMI